jgi:hypothetical protein
MLPDQPFYSDERSSMRQIRHLADVPAPEWSLWAGSLLAALLFLVPSGVFFYHAAQAAADPLGKPLPLYLIGTKAFIIGVTLSGLLARRALQSAARRKKPAGPSSPPIR